MNESPVSYVLLLICAVWVAAQPGPTAVPQRWLHVSGNKIMDEGHDTLGVQALANAIRATGANQPIAAMALDDDPSCRKASMTAPILRMLCPDHPGRVTQSATKRSQFRPGSF